MAELYRRYGRRLYRFGMQALGNDGLAEKMVQELLWHTVGKRSFGRKSRRIRADLR